MVFKAMEGLGYRMVSRLLPTITASAKVCNCQPGESWCQNKATSNYCTCKSDCINVTCRCSPAGCGN